MEIPVETQDSPVTLKTLPRNVWATSLTSFFMDISSEWLLTSYPSSWPMSWA